MSSDIVSPSTVPRSLLWRPNAIVFISNFCIMVLELVAGRIVAPYVGVSLYTWTSIIGIVLAGISLGNYLGGMLADRYGSLRLLGLVFISGGSMSLLILGVDWAGQNLAAGLPIVPRILVLTTVLFFPPSTLLGMTSPIVAKLAVQDLTRTGVTVGKIYAAGTAGSIAGTFATGFFLIARFGTHTIVWAVAVVITSMGLMFLLQRGAVAGALIVIAAGVSSFGADRAGLLEGPCLEETNYFCIRVVPDERDGQQVRKLVLDRLVHSFNSLTDPTVLTYDYETMYAELTGYLAVENSAPRALFIGGGGYTFPRYMEAVYPDSHLEVIEIDPGVTEIAYAALGLSRDTEIVTHNTDARQFMTRPPSAPFDIIFGDAFNDFSVPYHLTTNGFNELVADWLAPDGLYVVNLIDNARGDFLWAFVHTLQETFAYVYVAPVLENWELSPHSTFVIVASAAPLDDTRLVRAAIDTGSNTFAAKRLDDDAVDEALAAADPVRLTDRYAPVEQMLAPAYRNVVEPESP